MPAPDVGTSVPGVYTRGSRHVVTFTDPAGVRRKRSAATLAEARLLKSSLAAAVARGEYRGESRIRFDEYAAEWVRTFQGRTARATRPLTLRDYARDLETNVIPRLRRLRIAEITHRDITRQVADLTEAGYAPSGRRHPPFDPSTPATLGKDNQCSSQACLIGAPGAKSVNTAVTRGSVRVSLFPGTGPRSRLCLDEAPG
jgi:hypothetical protein